MYPPVPLVYTTGLTSVVFPPLFYSFCLSILTRVPQIIQDGLSDSPPIQTTISCRCNNSFACPSPEDRYTSIGLRAGSAYDDRSLRVLSSLPQQPRYLHLFVIPRGHGISFWRSIHSHLDQARRSARPPPTVTLATFH